VSARQLQSADKKMHVLVQENISKFLREDFCLEIPLFFLLFWSMSMQPVSAAKIPVTWKSKVLCILISLPQRLFLTVTWHPKSTMQTRIIFPPICRIEF